MVAVYESALDGAPTFKVTYGVFEVAQMTPTVRARRAAVMMMDVFFILSVDDG
jgi:hypothetical protein